MDKKYKFAIIGCGNIASRHAIQIKKSGELVAVCDIVREKAEKLSGENNARCYTSIDDLLLAEKEADIISICTPNGLHANHSILSLQAGKHVLCEKPMAISSADGRKMIDEAKKNNKQLYVVKQNRYNPPVVFIKKLIDENKLGKILSFEMNCSWNRPVSYYNSSWKGSLQLDGGILYTQFSHFVDLLSWMLGDVKTAKGIRKNYLHKNCIEFEDTGLAFLEMANGAIGTLHYSINSYKKNMEGSLILLGEKGTVKIGGQYLNELEYFEVEDETHPILSKGNSPNQYGFYEGSMSNHDKVYENLLKAIDDPSHYFIDSEETLRTVEIIEKIYEASPLLS